MVVELSEKVMLDIGVSEGFVETVVQAIMYSALSLQASRR